MGIDKRSIFGGGSEGRSSGEGCAHEAWQGVGTAAAGQAEQPRMVMDKSKTLRSRHQEPEESPGFLIWVITNRWQAAQRATLKPFGLTHVQMILLAALIWLEGEGPVSQRQLADQAATDPMMTSQVVRVLESRGLVRRYPHPSDGRARALETTAAGRSLVNRAVEAVEDCDSAFFSVLGPRIATLTAELKALHDAYR